MIIRRYQPVRFVEDSGICKCNSKDTQPVQDGDITQFQVRMEVCNYVNNLIDNGDFDDETEAGWTQSGGWTFGSDQIYTSTGSDDTITTSNKIMGSGIFYIAEIDITDNQGDPLLVYFGTNKVAEINENGKYYISGECTSDTTSEYLKIISPNSNSCSIERIALYPLESDIGLVISQVNADGTLTNVGFRTLLDDVNDANYTFFRLDRDSITVKFPWDYITDAVNGLGLSYGCYAISILGKCQNTNGQLGVFDSEMVMPSNFSSKGDYLNDTSFPWQCNDSVTVSVLADSGQMTANGATGTVHITEVNLPDGTAKVGMTYAFSVSVNLQVGSSMEVSFGGDTEVLSNGVNTFTLTAVNTDGLDILWVNQNGDYIEYFRMDVDDSSLTSIDTDFDSNVFDFKAAHYCTLLVAGANNQDAFGHRFESAQYVPKFRWKGNLRANDYPTDIEEHVNGFGQKIIDYSEVRKLVSLQLQGVPEYLTDFMAILRGMSKIYVDSEEYVAEEDLDLTPNTFCDSFKAELVLGEYRQELIGSNNKGLDAFSDINNYAVRAVDEEENVIFSDGEQIEFKG